MVEKPTAAVQGSLSLFKSAKSPSLPTVNQPINQLIDNSNQTKVDDIKLKVLSPVFLLFFSLPNSSTKTPLDHACSPSLSSVSSSSLCSFFTFLSPPDRNASPPGQSALPTVAALLCQNHTDTHKKSPLKMTFGNPSWSSGGRSSAEP